MKTIILQSIILFSSFSSFAYTTEMRGRHHDEPLFQLNAGYVYSQIDLSRYSNDITYRGTHLRLVTHAVGLLYVSTEYSTFPVHSSFPSWDNVHTRKFDINPQVSFSTENKHTSIFVFTGANYHEWSATRTTLPDVNPLSSRVPAGTQAEVKRWGVNFGCGFNMLLYENISLFGDYRFCFNRSHDYEKVRIMDVMTTLGLSISIPYPERGNKAKTFGIGKKLYKWTEKGGK